MARRRGRPEIRVGRLILAGGVALLLGCGPPGLGRGVWLSVDGPERYALTFDLTGRLVSGTMHHLLEDKKVAQWGFVGTRTRAGALVLRWGANNSLTAEVDLDVGELQATARLQDDSVFEGLFRRTAAAEIPGFAAQPELPYRLRPPAPGSGWEVAAPAEVGVAPRRLQATVRALTRGEAGLIHSLVIVRHGKLVLEEYFHGFARKDLHELESVTQSIASLLVGIARDRGEIGSLDTLVLQWFPEHAAAAGAGWQRVTLRHLLTMTAGLDWDRRDVIERHGAGPALFTEVFGRPVVHEPGSRWLINAPDVEVLGGILRRATGMQADELATRALFAPLGITTWDWERGKSEGYPSLGGTLHLRPLDMAKIGQLVLDGGRWQGEQVVSEEWIAESTSVAAGLEAEEYGYLWTRLETPPDAGRDPVIIASGRGSQFIHVVPTLDAVVVTTGGNHVNNKTFTIGDVLLRHLVPGFRRNEPGVAPGPSAVEALTSGFWHATVGEDDYVYEFTQAGASLGGRLHQINDGRQISVIPLTGVVLRGTAIEIRHGGFPSYRGKADLERGRIEGGLPREPQFREMNLRRVEKAHWQMLRPRMEPAAASDSTVLNRPEERADDWPVAGPSDVGIDPAAVEATVRAILEDEAAALHSLLVVRDGQLVVEEYFHGWGRDDLHGVLSCTKSVASLLVGMAIDRGRLTGVEVPLLDFFPEYRDAAAPGWDAIRLEHLLTMTTGLDWARNEIGTPPPDGVDRTAEVLGHDAEHPPGSRFVYIGRGLDLLAEILLDATGMEADSFAEAHLFAPLGIRDWDWSERRWQGHPDMSAALKMRPRDMAKLGQLVLDEGAWQGRQVVSAEWIRESTQTHIPETPHDVQYGYLWWRVDPPPPRLELGPLTFANGIGSQFIVVVPSARMVLVATGGNFYNGRQFDIVRVAERHILPGVSLGPTTLQ